MEQTPDIEKEPTIEMPPIEPSEEITEEQNSEEKISKREDGHNYRELRKAKESAERERDEMRRKIEEMQSAAQNVQSKPDPSDDEVELQPDDIPEWRHVNKYIKKLEVKIDNYEKRQTIDSAENRLKSQYPDFDNVVSSENVEALRQQYPELASTLHYSKDVYAKAVAAYTMIKRLGIARDDSYDSDRERALKNSNKPRPLASVSPQQGDTPLSRANAFAEGLTDELKEQLRKEMNEAMKYR